MSSHLPRFSLPHPVAVGDRVELPAAEARHVRVRRLRPGDAVALLDGAGNSYLGELTSATRDAAVVRVTAARPADEHESSLDLTLAAGLLKNDRFEWLIEKATELGVTRVQPVVSEFTVAQPSANRLARWQEIARSAAKQSGRSRVPTVEPPLALAALLAHPGAARLVCSAHGDGDPLLGVERPAVAALQLIVGCEGGFSAEEIAAARTAGCRIVTLGPRILRAETAAITAVALCQARWGDLGSP